jgi:dTMP kinase
MERLYVGFWCLMATARFISIEGGEGTGKSTQIKALTDMLRQHGIDVVITREPGGTEGAETIRQLLLSGSAGRWGPRAEALLFAAARSDHVERLIRPALRAGKWVISDRFLDSSRAYQSGGSGLSDGDILTLHEIGSEGLLPDRTLVLDLPQEASMTRMCKRDGENVDRIGGRDGAFHKGVYNNFISYAASEPQRVRTVDASGTVAEVTKRLWDEIADLLP